MLLYAMGYNVAESYFFNQPYLQWYNLLIADPLMTPFAARPEIEMLSPSNLSRGEAVEIHAFHEDGIAEIVVYQDNIPVAQSEDASLLYTPPEDTIDELSLFVVAKSRASKREPSQWPIEETWLQHHTQGWTSLSLTLVESAPAPKETGCQTVPPSRSLLIFLLVSYGLFVKRREPFLSP